ncbi:MAG TPA: cupin domain-containing protein [Anaerohalosphaeraceae bacterium]|nr:cupin domain-containing protein [Anaerohalosphaeraceae bacterium]
MNSLNNRQHNVIVKPWGQEEILELNDCYLVKRLTMHRGHRCSLQYHNKKRETVYVLSGKLKIDLGHQDSELNSAFYTPGDFITIPAKMVHRMEAVEDCVYLESSTPDTDDVVRLSDDYNRGER